MILLYENGQITAKMNDIQGRQEQTMKHTGLKIVLALILLLGLVCAAALAQALTLSDLP